MTKKLKTLKAKDIKPYSNNPRINDNAVEAVMESIKQCEYIAPIIVDEDNIILAGHTRYKAMQTLGKADIEVMQVTGLSDEQKRKYRILDNKTNELAVWDFEALEVELADIDFNGFDFGFDVSLDDEPQEIVEDEVPEEVETRCKLGDLWQLGNHRLVCGNSTDVAVIDRLMDGVKADLVFTDPPYGMNLDTDYSKMNGNEGHGKKYDKGFVDDFHPEMIDAIMLMNAKETFIWGADYFAELIPNRNSGSWFVWDKRENELTGANVDKRFGSMFELCWSKEKHKREIFRFMWAGMMKQKDVDDKRYHPTQKPIKLASWFLERYSKENDIVVDIFGGSGSTLIACEQLNRKCYMAEISPEYCSVILQRWENFTGEKAVQVRPCRSN